MDLREYFNELKRRHVIRIGLAYLVVAWLIMQVADTILPTFNAPDYIMQSLLFLLAIGFPVSLVLAWVYEVTPEGIQKTGDITPYGAAHAEKNRRLNTIIIGALVLAALLFGYTQFSSDTSQIARPEHIPANTLAVLPLINLGGDPSLEYFSDGVTQEIIDELAKVKTLTVRAFSQALQFKDKEISHAEVANILGVHYLISGSARVFRDSVKLSIELFNPYNNERIWNGSFVEPMDNAPTIQARIASQVASSLNVKLTSAEKRSLEKAKTTDGEAFNYFLKAKAELLKLTPAGFDSSISMLEAAIELDPNYSQAYTLMAWTYLLKSGGWFGGTMSTSEYLSIVSPLIERSIALDASSSDIYLIRANAYMFSQNLLGKAKKDVEYALALNSWPKTPTTYCVCTIVSTYLAKGELKNAKKYANLGREIDPGNVFIWWDRANIHLVEGELQKAQAIYEEALQVTDVPFTRWSVGLSYYHDKKFDTALSHLEIGYEKIPFGLVTAYLSNTHYMLGNRSQSEQYRMELEQRISSGEPNLNLAMAIIAAHQLDTDQTLTWLEKALENKDQMLAYMTSVDPIFKPFHKEPRFIELRRKMQYYD